ncbi:classical arabinogalactan protein 9 [Trichoplusia ni]|uniref:Classical arabinogalactan protein 9 n=1 Tax=Trichoplusia ni TaxID=7111 RepID=A0A7E5WF23_TRINI|nr:classical arabinogalactan protein 9 [Trichoplusia ni]
MTLPTFSKVLSVFVSSLIADPAPGRVPKVYNALITSNQNLEPSKAYPVYQPVLHDAFAFSYQPAVFYGGDFLSNGLLPAAPALPPKLPQPSAATPTSTADPPAEASPSSTEAPATSPEPAKPEPESSDPSPAPPQPKTESPIPLNEFGLPPQVLPLGHIDPLYNALPQFSPFTYRYPGVRFYDPYDPFGFSPYANFPIYRPLTNVLGQSLPVAADNVNNSPPSADQNAQTPPPEPSDLNILNYSSKNPSIPNVPPPPLPQGGLKSDKSE